MTDCSGGRGVELCSRDPLREALERLPGSRVTLMGLGTFGGGVGAARFLSDRGCRLTVTDLRGERALHESLRALDGVEVDFKLGGHDPRHFAEADLVVAGPGVPRTSTYLWAAAEAGVPITSPMNIFLTLCDATVVAVTGSNGKSTTTALVARMLSEAGHKVWLGGNIGISLLPCLDDVSPHSLVVLELSSFQLEDAAALEWSPHVGVVTNITPNHLDRHGSFANYAQAKRNIAAYQSAEDWLVLNAADETTRQWVAEGVPAQVFLFGAEGTGAADLPCLTAQEGRLLWRDQAGERAVCSLSEISLPGRHNVQNVMAAAAAAICAGAPQSVVPATLAGFEGLAHRLELVGQRDGVRYYNDSYSTTPESTVAALCSFRGPVVLIAGGYDKKLDLSPIARAAVEHAQGLVTLGDTGPALARSARHAAGAQGRPLNVLEAGSLVEAIQGAARIVPRGGAVVFSPGCASYDMFQNCRQRGEIFRQIVLNGDYGLSKRA